MLRKIALISIVLFCCGCATLYNPATGRKEVILIDSQTEQALGRNAAKEMLRRQALSENKPLQQRVQKIGRKVSEVSDRRDITYEFYVLKGKELNAVTLPGGFIYVNEGLMQALDDDELSFVLGHEIGHVAARHIAKKIQANMAYQLLVGAALTGAGSRNAEAAREVARGVDTVFNLIELSYSRKDEYEADKLGVKYSSNSGFKPRAAISALEKIKKHEGTNWRLMRYFRTHPYLDERIEALKKLIGKI